ncbi:MAG: SCO family protein [Maricaulaceae bacterium]
MPRFIIASLALASLCLSACGDTSPSTNSPAGQSGGVVVASGTAAIGGPFELVNTKGETVTEDVLLGKPSLIYFGFSYCPDVCPTALQKMGALQARTDKKGTRLNYILITIDPERDTPESLAPYITSRGFPLGLQGFSGSQEQINTALAAYRVYAQKAEDPGSAAEYTMDHSDIIYLMNADGTFADVFTHNDSLPDMEKRVKAAL